MNERTCPVCGQTYNTRPPLSRKDNSTEICPACGLREALETVPLTDEQKAEIIAIAQKGSEQA